jgi:DNA-binding transcriptional MerR regulator
MVPRRTKKVGPRKRSPRRRALPPEGLTLAELAAQAGVTPRTARFYLECGALPQPEFRGARTRYGPAHVASLFAILALQKQGLELAEIGRRLSATRPRSFAALMAQPRELFALRARESARRPFARLDLGQLDPLAQRRLRQV